MDHGVRSGYYCHCQQQRQLSRRRMKLTSGFALLLCGPSSFPVQAFLLPPTKRRTLSSSWRPVLLSMPDQQQEEQVTPASPTAQPLPLPSPTVQLPQFEPDSPDRAISIVSELKANAALFAAFAYGGLSVPSILTVTESKVTSVTTSLSTTRPIPASNLIQAFVVLDVVTLCLMVSCVASSQLLIYRLTDGSWFDMERTTREEWAQKHKERRQQAPKSALGRLVASPEYRVEFFIARTTFDLGLVTLLLAVAVRAIAMFDETISLPVTVLLSGTSLLLAVAFLQSYWAVFSPLETTNQSDDGLSRGGRRHRPSTSTSRLPSPVSSTQNVPNSGFVPFSVLATMVIAAGFYVWNGLEQVDNDQTTQTQTETRPSKSLQLQEVKSHLNQYSKEASDAKLKSVLDKIATEKEGVKTSQSTSTKRPDRRSTTKPPSSSSSQSSSKKDPRSTPVAPPPEALSSPVPVTDISIGKNVAPESSIPTTPS